MWNLKKAELIETVEWWLPEARGKGKSGNVGKGYTPAVRTWINSGDLMHSTVIIIINTV